jgi:polygalacturonase
MHCVLTINAGFWDLERGLPTFPLNTDGIDPMASNVHIYNGDITNYDDAIAFKPCRNYYEFCNECAGGYVHDIRTNFSVGMTIGSVPPNSNVNCVRDVTFRNVHMAYPLKGIYLKSNPGTSGQGVIKNITYENVVMDRAGNEIGRL